MLRGDKLVINEDADAKLFADLTHEGILHRLPRLDLAAGELPQPSRRLAGCAPAREHAPVVHDDRGDDVDELHVTNSRTGFNASVRQS